MALERLECEGLGEHRVGAGRQELGRDLVMAGDAEDPDALRLGIAPEVPADFHAVELGHHRVEDQERGAERAQLDQGLVAVARRLDLEAAGMVREELDEHVHDLTLVVDDQHPRRRRWCGIDRHPVSLEEALELVDRDPRMAAGRLEGTQPALPYPGLHGWRRDLAVRGGLTGRQRRPRGRFLWILRFFHLGWLNFPTGSLQSQARRRPATVPRRALVVLRSLGRSVTVPGVVCARDAQEGPGKAVKAAATPSL